jgi:mono/diheme cytochrome c family protein
LRAEQRKLACAMPRRPRAVCTGLSFALIAAVVVHYARLSRAQAGSPAAIPSSAVLRAARSSPLDLEVAGELSGLAPGATRYITRDTLLGFPQLRYTVSNDANFTAPTQVSGVSLEELSKHLAVAPESDLIVAMSADKYYAFYPRAYVAAHDPVLVLTINEQPPANWPKDSEGRGFSMGPYLISHPKFTPSFKVLSHADEPQIPWGVVRLEFRDEKTVFGAIAPRGPRASNPAVVAGYRIARQNCFRCHNMGSEGGLKAARPWLVLSTWASASPEYFAAYVRDPKSKNPRATMPASPAYDDATLNALCAYFQTFSAREKP